jgi:hypothetical protein
MHFTDSIVRLRAVPILAGAVRLVPSSIVSLGRTPVRGVRKAAIESIVFGTTLIRQA